MIDPEAVLVLADELVSMRDKWASLPSQDLQVRALCEALCAKLNEAIAAAVTPAADPT